MDILLRRANIEGRTKLCDIAFKNGEVIAIEENIPQDVIAEEEIDLQGTFVFSGFVESHLHLDKSNIQDRCKAQRGDLAEAIELVARAKKDFSEKDIYQRSLQSLKKCIQAGTTFVRTQIEVDPVIGLKGLNGVQAAAKELREYIDVEICVFPQEGLLNYPGTEELLISSLKQGIPVLGAAPYTDSNPHGQIDRIFELASQYDVDIDMHLDFFLTTEQMDLPYVLKKTVEYGYQNRVTIGHVTTLSTLLPDALKRVAAQMCESGVHLTVMPATDLFLMGRAHQCNVPRGLTPAHILKNEGVHCSISTNNILNPFTPMGDGSLCRMANLYANICQIGTSQGMQDCFEMVSKSAAKVVGKNYDKIIVGTKNMVILTSVNRENAVAELATPQYIIRNGVITQRHNHYS